jgi:hypothetical protein
MALALSTLAEEVQLSSSPLVRAFDAAHPRPGGTGKI